MSLKNDVCRCHDSTCQLKNICQRYIERKTGGEWTPHMGTMREGFTGNLCKNLIRLTSTDKS